MTVLGESGSQPPRLGRYELITRIGQGGMAEVQLALQRGPAGFEKLVVVKLVHENLASQKPFVDMLLDEARNAALVKHPNVVDIYDLGEVEGRYFIAMEYLEGEPLLAVLRAGRDGQRLDALSTARLIADTAEGLDAAHELRSLAGDPLELVHHDVSLGNIVVLYNGRVKLVDFGVAKAGQSAATNARVQGKFGYMAPEKLRGDAGDRRSDLWSLGCVLWESLTLTRLFKGATDGDTMQHVLESKIHPPSQINGDVPADFDPIVLRALERDPAQRYASAKAMAADLEDVLRRHGYAAKNEAIATYMQATFATHIAARKQLLQQVSSKGRASPDVVEAAFHDGAIASGTPILSARDSGMPRRPSASSSWPWMRAPAASSPALRLLPSDPGDDANFEDPTPPRVPVTPSRAGVDPTVGDEPGESGRPTRAAGAAGQAPHGIGAAPAGARIRRSYAIAAGAAAGTIAALLVLVLGGAEPVAPNAAPSAPGTTTAPAVAEPRVTPPGGAAPAVAEPRVTPPGSAARAVAEPRVTGAPSVLTAAPSGRTARADAPSVPAAPANAPSGRTAPNPLAAPSVPAAPNAPARGGARPTDAPAPPSVAVLAPPEATPPASPRPPGTAPPRGNPARGAPPRIAALPSSDAKIAALPEEPPKIAAITADRPTAADLSKAAFQAWVRGDGKAAIALYRRAIQITPAYAPAWRGLGLVYEKQGDRTAARAAYQRYLQLQPSAPDAAGIRARLPPP